MRLSKMFLLLLLASLMVNASTTVKKRVALVSLTKTNVTALEVAATALSIRDVFVNSGKYDVLDRDNLATVLTEQEIGISSFSSKDSAVRVGEILNVNFIVVGTLMQFQGAYILELHLIDVATSAIIKSGTGKCTSSQNLLYLGSRVAEKIVMKKKVNKSKSVQLPAKPTVNKSTTPKQIKTVVAVDTLSDTVKCETENLFQKVGLSDIDYNRFKLSGKTLQEWAEGYKREPGTAVAIGLATSSSGFFYTHDYGSAMLVSLVKVFGILGIVTNYEEGGSKFWGSIALYATTAGVDAVASSVSAGRKKQRLNNLIDAIPTLSVKPQEKKISLNIDRRF